LPADDDGPVHLELGHNARQNATSDGDVSGERAFFVDVVTFSSLTSQEIKCKAHHQNNSIQKINGFMKRQDIKFHKSNNSNVLYFTN
jgi:hypothetical protein